jgi:acetyl esterase/lipase
MASPQFTAIREAMSQRPRPWEQSTSELRAGWEAQTQLLPLPADVTAEAVDAAGVAAEWVSVPESDASRVILYLHGGGYVIGSLNTHRDAVGRICRAAGARALNVGYRLAPENPFPAALDDATGAYKWLLGQGVEPAKVIIAGDSAGGGLAVATMMSVRDAGQPLPAVGVLMSPWVDMEGSGASMLAKQDVDPTIRKEWLLRCATDYLGDGDRRNPLASPLYGDMRGLPPLLIQVGESETLLDDSVRLADKAKAAGVEVTLDVWDEMTHLWQLMAAMVPEGQHAIDRIGEWVREKLSLSDHAKHND